MVLCQCPRKTHVQQKRGLYLRESLGIAEQYSYLIDSMALLLQ